MPIFDQTSAEVYRNGQVAIYEPNIGSQVAIQTVQRMNYMFCFFLAKHQREPFLYHDVTYTKKKKKT